MSHFKFGVNCMFLFFLHLSCVFIDLQVVLDDLLALIFKFSCLECFVVSHMHSQFVSVSSIQTSKFGVLHALFI